MKGSRRTIFPAPASHGSANNPIDLSNDEHDGTGRPQKRRRGNTGLGGSARTPHPTMTATATVHKQRYKHKDKLTSIARPLQEMTKDTSDDQTLIPARTTVLQTTELLELIVSALTPGVRLLNEHTETSTREHPQLDYTWSIDTVQTTVREVQVLDATELREPTLKIMRLVCKRFRDVVDASPRLQKRLGEVVGGKDNIVYVID